MEIRQAETADIDAIASIYSACFPGERNHQLWIEASFRSFPRGVYYVVSVENEICGYILWCAKNGFRDRTIVELEQIGIHPNQAGQGLGRRLIEESIVLFERHVATLGHAVGALIVTTSEGNYAEQLYHSSLGVKPAARITGYGSGNEIIMYSKRDA